MKKPGQIRTAGSVCLGEGEEQHREGAGQKCQIMQGN